ncbi:DNA (cytosine-5-)-methyltransferase [Bacillus bombysepticus]|uniref:Cytosine-specific methyltransferase n=1 Tax=Bacillus thuringiensis serovar kumamotoensis TaxID=132267 RepID=A0A9X6JV41_BACUK|nr:DNA (cytosine-5-)-methyltransferase [Bacillus thuringiensis]MEC2873212.1 DNA (cytosine-5-)-methyltransferase [Bacillus cereus]OTZ79083.1 DNA (cytosine-5-)-methyltransferase [Bacillus thuringiensis serovar kumamtoensis]
MSLTFIDLFAGIGGFRLGMEQAGHKCLGYVECDPRCEKCKKFTKHIPSTKHNHTICTECGKEKRQHARFSYESIHNAKGEWTAYDITTVTNDDLRLLRGQVDVICGGFPCQAFSIAGKRLGFAETRGTLFFEIARFAKEIQPRYLFLENVRGLLSHEKGNTFATILSTLDELGYDAEWQVLNSKDIGPNPVPQNRERVFIIGHSRRHSTREVFPIRENCKTVGIQRVGNVNPSGNGMNGNVFSAEGLAPTLTTNKGEGPKVLVKGMLDIKGKDQIRRVYGIEGISPCLTTMQGGGQEPKVLVREATKKGYDEAQIGDSVNFSNPSSKTRRGRVGKGVAQTLDTSCNQAIIENKPPYRIRRLTPKECWRLQGFPDWAFDRAREVNSDSQLYKQAGNSVTVPVIHEIAKRLV